MTQPTVFSVDAANQRLPLIRAVVRDIMTLARDLQQREDRLDEVRGLHEQRAGESPHSEEFAQMEQAMEADYQRFEELEEELLQIDVRVVDRSSGMVEVLSTADDRPVWINWQPGESEFRFWRSCSDDRMMRRPLLEAVAESRDEFFAGESGPSDSSRTSQ